MPFYQPFISIKTFPAKTTIKRYKTDTIHKYPLLLKLNFIQCSQKYIKKIKANLGCNSAFFLLLFLIVNKSKRTGNDFGLEAMKIKKTFS